MITNPSNTHQKENHAARLMHRVRLMTNWNVEEAGQVQQRNAKHSTRVKHLSHHSIWRTLSSDIKNIMQAKAKLSW